MRIFRNLLIALICLAVYADAQGQYESAVKYMDYLGTIDGDMAQDYLSYMSAVAHTSNARKMEKRRQDVLAGIKEGQKKVDHLKAFSGDVALREAYRKYLSLLMAVMSEDYGQIVNMEEIAEQSYDKMEAFMLAQEKAREKLHAATDSLRVSFRSFAKKNNVNLVESESKTSKKLGLTSEVMSYYNKIYLIHFKPYKQEAYTISALNEGDINGIEQSRSAQVSYADEGLENLKKIKAFQNDYSLVIACRKLLEFQKKEGESRMAGLTDYLIKKDEFSKFKKEYDSKPESQRSRGDVDDYNSFVNEMNKLSDGYNKINNQLYTERAALITNWNTAGERFLDSHVPK